MSGFDASADSGIRTSSDEGVETVATSTTRNRTSCFYDKGLEILKSGRERSDWDNRRPAGELIRFERQWQADRPARELSLGTLHELDLFAEVQKPFKRLPVEAGITVCSPARAEHIVKLAQRERRISPQAARRLADDTRQYVLTGESYWIDEGTRRRSSTSGR